MKCNNQKGFAHIGALILSLLVLSAVGFSGYYVWHKNHDKKQTVANSQHNSVTNQQTATITTYDECAKATGSEQLQTYPLQCVAESGETFTDQSDETVNWTPYTAPDESFSMRIPDGWNIDQNSKTNGDLQIMDDTLAIKPGTKGMFYVTPGYGKDYNTGMTIGFYGPNVSSAYSTGSATKGATKQASLETQSGLEIQKYFYKQTTDPGTPGLQKGDESYTYEIWRGKKLVLCYYGFYPSPQADYHANVEAALKTVKIL